MTLAQGGGSRRSRSAAARRFGAVAAAIASLPLVGCTKGVAAPAPVLGAWGADCSDPFVTFSGGTVHVGPDKADYRLTAATLAGSDLTIGYTSAAGAVVEHYLLQGDTLRLVSGSYGGQDATWHKAPMHRCR